MSTIPLTKRGAELLRDELQRLKSIERPAVINAIAEARAQGDLSENAEYDAAKEKQGFIEGRIAEAIAQAEASGVTRKALTPFLLQRIFELTEGKSLAANIALVKNNALVAAQIAVALADLNRRQAG